MTPQEAAELVVTCTATGLSALPLWEYLPGMLVAFTVPQYEAPPIIGRTRVRNTTPNGGTVLYDWQHVSPVPTAWLRPDFTDDLTVQALYLLVRRAYAEADGLIDLRDWGDGTVRLRISGDVYEGSDYAVFARALAKAPVRS